MFGSPEQESIGTCTFEVSVSERPASGSFSTFKKTGVNLSLLSPALNHQILFTSPFDNREVNNLCFYLFFFLNIHL